MGCFLQLHTLVDWALLVLRLGVGISFLVHGTQKRPMWKATPSAQLSSGMRTVMRILSIAEPLGGLGLILGFLTQLAALGLIVIMLGAIRLKALKLHKTYAEHGGWELDAVLLAALVALFFIGAGRIALDSILFGL